MHHVSHTCATCEVQDGSFRFIEGVGLDHRITLSASHFSSLRSLVVLFGLGVIEMCLVCFRVVVRVGLMWVWVWVGMGMGVIGHSVG
jgi:hypothetical protein